MVLSRLFETAAHISLNNKDDNRFAIRLLKHLSFSQVYRI